ncbi:PqqD family protein [Prevotella histicola]
MKVKKGFNLREVCGEHIIVAEGDENIDFSNIISMNESSAFLWEEVQKMESFSIDDLVNILCSQYEVDKETAKKDAEALAAQWGKAGIIEGNDIPEGSIETVSTIETEPKKRDSATIMADNSAQEQPKKKGFFKRLFG